MLFLLSGCFNDFISLSASHILISLLVFIAKVKRVRHNFFSHSGVQMPEISSGKCNAVAFTEIRVVHWVFLSGMQICRRVTVGNVKYQGCYHSLKFWVEQYMSHSCKTYCTTYESVFL